MVSLLGGLLRWGWRLFLAGLVLFVILVVLGRFLPLPSTLMLGRWATGQEVTRIWQPLEAMSPALVSGVVASEDQRFCQHRGVDFVALEEVLSDEDGPSRGASTVTMQVAKNMFLWPGRSYLRKGLEIPVALVIDFAWGKKRVMEVYLNVAEWGEGIFGAEAAAQHYYKKSARALSEAEAARMVAALPNPFTRAADRSSTGSRRVLRRMDDVVGLTDCVR